MDGESNYAATGESALAAGAIDDAGLTAQGSFEALYNREFDRIFAATRAFLHDREAALDATQEAFSRAYARWNRLSTQTWVTAWVMTTALNLCRRKARGRGEGRALADDADAEFAGPSPDRIGLLDALRRLPPRQRQAVVLHYIGDLPVSVVAESMGLSEGTVKAHLFRARNALRIDLEEKDD